MLQTYNNHENITCIKIRKLQMMSCDSGEINDGRFADCLLALKIRAMRLVFVNKAAYTTVKQNPAPNLWLVLKDQMEKKQKNKELNVM